jgi:hypothetical protein
MSHRKILLYGAFVVIAATLVAVQSATAQKKEIKALTALDYAEIQQLYARYNWTIDSGDAEGWAAVFTPDGIFSRYEGHDALVKFATDFSADPKRGAHIRHWNTNLLITPTAGGAHGQVYLSSLDFTAMPPAFLNSVAYSDDLVKTALGWRFKKRVIRNTLSIDSAQ